MSENGSGSKGGKKFSPANMDKLGQSEQKQSQLRERTSGSRAFTQSEQAALQITSKDAFKDFWDSALTAKAAFDAEHERGARRLAKGAANLATSAHDFLRDVSPMVDIVKDFGAPYGGMAIGTICFLFAVRSKPPNNTHTQRQQVAKNRTAMESDINATLLHIQDRLPGVRMYQHIYSDDGELDQLLQSKIVDAYETFMDFCIAAINFYTPAGRESNQQPDVGRWIAALHGRGQVGDQAALVQGAVVDVRLVCEDLLSKNVHAVKINLEDVKSLNMEQKQQIQVLQNDSDFTNLERVRNLLGLEPFSPETHLVQLDRHRSDVRAEFRVNPYSPAAPDEALRVILDDSSYQEWRGSPCSRLLVLSGKNCVPRATHCWVSPVALDLAAKLEADTAPNSDPSVFYLLGRRDEEDTHLHVLSSLVYQLLSINKTGMRDEAQFRELWAALQRYKAASESSGGRVREVKRALEDAALRSLNMFGAGRTVWIVLDRVDRCRTAPGPGATLSQKDRLALLRSMVCLVERAAATVKILAVSNRVDWRVEEQEDELGQEREGSVVIRTFSQGPDTC
ncbi:LIM domain-containing protein [Purpureocillium lavendulum]|uniref:LIM domain-containing protein n=1 Tax=Purpureocillium lavendulum TaxID=1247861 RepID=A0AB34FV97_9HYPO|nr:LIM domain-containing protein [Purpureocillium lavendulum]